MGGLSKKLPYKIIAHIAIIAAVLGGSEPFDRTDISPWVILVGLSLLLIYYFIFRTIKLQYIPLQDIGIAFCSVLFWLALLFTLDHWTNITGWDALIYIVYPILAGIFFVCLLVMNFIVFLIHRFRARIM